MENEIPVIAVTGGACGGKTAFLEKVLPEKLMGLGFRYFPVPEIPTLMIPYGIPDISNLRTSELKKYVEVERQFLLTHLAMRDKAIDFARVFPEDKCVVGCDRGAKDVKAHLPEGVFEAICEEEGLTLADVQDCYKVVIDMVTAADGAENYYTLENNKARQENAEEARMADIRTREAWNGHPKLRIIKSCEDFSLKMNRATSAVLHELGLPAPIEIEKKFLVRKRPDFRSQELKKAVKVFIEQIYLNAPSGEESRIRRRTQGASSIYFKTKKIPVVGSTVARQEMEHVISPLDYIYFQQFRELKIKTVRKWRYCFIHNYQYFELDEIFEPQKLWLLEIELTEENDKVDLPPFLVIEREVTGEAKYTNHGIARGL
ncbi:MAG: AAA family ATPase [bacterium]|nr:AAA family ATPase [bacterium]